MVDLEEKAEAGAGEDITSSAWKQYVDDVLSGGGGGGVKDSYYLAHLHKQRERPVSLWRKS